MAGSHLAQTDPTYTKFGVGVLLLPNNTVKVQVEYAQWLIHFSKDYFVLIGEVEVFNGFSKD